MKRTLVTILGLSFSNSFGQLSSLEFVNPGSRGDEIELSVLFELKDLGYSDTRTNGTSEKFELMATNGVGNQVNRIASAKTDTSSNEITIVYKTDNLIIQRLTHHVYEHISFLNTNDFGRVACNGMIIVNENEAIVFDTPSGDESSGELVDYVVKKLQCKIKAIIPTHFHEDCVGGLEKFNEYNIPAYASNKTLELLRNKNKKFSKPIIGFNDSLTLNIGDKKVYAEYFGEGHTKDNIIGSFPEDNAIFGGCLIKELSAKKGNLEDANIKEWSDTVRKLKQKYPQTKIVIPGHGKSGGTELFDYTIELFK